MPADRASERAARQEKENHDNGQGARVGMHIKNNGTFVGRLLGSTILDVISSA